MDGAEQEWDRSLVENYVLQSFLLPDLPFSVHIHWERKWHSQHSDAVSMISVQWQHLPF